MPEITFQSQKIYYTVSGAGSALVFIHGFGVDSRFWDAFVSRFQKSHQVICIDMPGAGKSGAPSYRNIVAPRIKLPNTSHGPIIQPMSVIQ